MPPLSWLPWGSPEPPQSEPDERNSRILQSIWDPASDTAEKTENKLDSLPPHLLVLSSFALGSVSTALAAFVYARYFRRIPNGDWITPDAFQRKRWIKGLVTSVGDADNFRLYHTPAFGWRWLLKFRTIPTANKDLKNQTIHIRIAGVDAPEASHFGRPAQPYAEESLAWLKAKIEGKRVYCQLIRRDQYSRIVANVTLSPSFLPGSTSFGKNLSLEMLRAGWVMTYEQAGAEYGNWGKEEFLRVEGEARAARRGIWEEGTKGETPAEYKRRFSRPADVAKAVTPVKSPSRARSLSLLGRMKRLWRR